MCVPISPLGGLPLGRAEGKERGDARVGLAEATVKRHLANIYEKVGVKSWGEAAREALLKDWITIEEITAEEDAEGEWTG